MHYPLPFFLHEQMKKNIPKKKTAVIAVVITAIILCCTFFIARYRHYIAFAHDVGLTISQTTQMYGPPNAANDWMLGLVVEAERGNWEKVLEMTNENDTHTEIGTYYHNLAKAMTGSLSDGFMDYYQPFERGLFLPITQGSGPFSISCAGEVWWQLGEITLAEHSAMLGMIFFQKEGGAPRFYRRLAQIAHVNGDKLSAAKYEGMLGKTVTGWEDKVALANHNDTLVLAGEYRKVLHNLLEFNPDNIMAYEYLLCYDLMTQDLESFMEDYIPGKVNSELYQQATLIYLAATGKIKEETYMDTLDEYAVSKKVFERFCAYNESSASGNFNLHQRRFEHTYWFWFQYAMRNE